MASIYVRKNSPYYWIRVYDKFEQNPAKKRKPLKTKIPVTKADRKRYDAARAKGPRTKCKYEGTAELRRLLKLIDRGLVDKEVRIKLKIDLFTEKTLSQAVKEYTDSRSSKGDKTGIKKKSVENYTRHANHFIEATGKDVKIYKYNESDFKAFLSWMEEKQYSEKTRNTFTSHLSTLWNYFVKKQYCVKNIIEIYEGEAELKPEDIPLDDFQIILKYYKDRPERLELIYYLLLSMNRISTAMHQLRKDVFFKEGYILMLNWKGRRKKAPKYPYPLYQEFEKLIIKIMGRPDQDGSGRLFSHFKLVEEQAAEPFSWWTVDQKKMAKVGLLPKTYQMKQIRKTLPSYAYNILNMEEEEIQFLLDHTDVSVSRNHYINKKLAAIKSRFDSAGKVGGEIIKDVIENPYILRLTEEEITLKITEAKKHIYKKKFNLTAEELQELLWEKPIGQIAKSQDVSDQVIHKWIKRWELERPGKGYWQKIKAGKMNEVKA